MSTDLTNYQQPTQQVALIDYQARAVHRLAEWVQSADAAFSVARRLVQSSFVPQQYRPKNNSPEAIEAAAIESTAAILAGLEIGMSPMASLRAFDNILGTAAPKALTLRAIVQSFGHEMELVESTATRAIMRGRRRGATTWQTVTWTFDRAKDLGLTGKDQWKKQPGTMLVARCTSELSRLIAADAILGIGYTSEEITDGADESVPVEYAAEPQAEPEPEKPATRRMSRAKPSAPEPDEPTEPESSAGPDMITEPQSKKMHAQFRERGLDRDEALDYCGGVVGHSITTTKELTKAEASQVIDDLERLEENAEPTEPTFDGLDQ